MFHFSFFLFLIRFIFIFLPFFLFSLLSLLLSLFSRFRIPLQITLPRYHHWLVFLCLLLNSLSTQIPIEITLLLTPTNSRNTFHQYFPLLAISFNCNSKVGIIPNRLRIISFFLSLVIFCVFL